jgi:hypothetical protein
MVTRLAIVILVVFTSCAAVPKTIYRDAGLSFKIAEDFRIGKSDTYKKNQATYIPLYLRDKNLYAKFSIIWLPGTWNLDKEIWNYADALKEIYQKEDPVNKPEFGEVKDAMFGSNHARQVEYIVPNDGPRMGSYTTFHCDSITVIIGGHGTPETQALIQRCRKLIEESYSCSKGQKAKNH